jgi:DNA-binding NtrC family response regulator
MEASSENYPDLNIPPVIGGPCRLPSTGNAGSLRCSGIVYRSRCMHKLVCQATSFARSSATVLVTGENGTGKELFARLIHDASDRAASRFGRVNCAALSESLTESELFGHERGAFTGADRTRIGRFEWANGGTLLLDEISEIGTSFQAKLLRVLEQNEIQRVGSNETIPTDVRIVATSNRDLASSIGEGKFREDLFYRLNVLRLDLPSLRERREDIPLLANLYLQKFREESSIPVRGFSKRALSVLCDYYWPGNVRQLRNVVLSACIMAESPLIEVHDLPGLEQPVSAERLPAWMYRSSLEEIERKVIIENLNRMKGNKSVVAGILGVTTKTLSNKVRQYRELGLISMELT